MCRARTTWLKYCNSCCQSLGYLSEAFLRGGQGGHGPPVRTLVPPVPPPNETGCKVARLYNSCINSVALHSWCQIIPFTQSCIMSSKILGPQMKMWPPHWPPQNAAARNAPVTSRCSSLSSILITHYQSAMPIPYSAISPCHTVCCPWTSRFIANEFIEVHGQSPSTRTPDVHGQMSTVVVISTMVLVVQKQGRDKFEFVQSPLHPRF